VHKRRQLRLTHPEDIALLIVLLLVVNLLGLGSLKNPLKPVIEPVSDFLFAVERLVSTVAVF